MGRYRVHDLEGHLLETPSPFAMYDNLLNDTSLTTLTNRTSRQLFPFDQFPHSYTAEDKLY